MELLKDAGWSDTKPALYHFRSLSRHDVDIVLEDGAGRVIGVEVKASSTVKSSDLRSLRALSEAAGDRFARGIILYMGEQVIPFGETIHALPVDAIWRR